MLSCFHILTKNECERKHVASFLLSELQDGTGMDKASSAGKWDQNKCTFQDKVLLLFIKASFARKMCETDKKFCITLLWKFLKDI